MPTCSPTLAAAHSATPDELPRCSRRSAPSSRPSAAARRELEEALAGVSRARALRGGACRTPAAAGAPWCREPDGPVERLRPLAQAYGGAAGRLFVGVVETPPTVLVAAAADSGVDAGRALKAALESRGGRGGGNARLAQGTVQDRAELDAVIASILSA